jgi:hypothetical protein
MEPFNSHAGEVKVMKASLIITEFPKLTDFKKCKYFKRDIFPNLDTLIGEFL